MKLVYIANARFPTGKAHSIQIAKMCEAFTGVGVALELVVPDRGILQHHNLAAYYGLRHAFPVTRLWTINVLPTTSFGFRLSSFVFGLSSFFYLVLKQRQGIIYSIDMDHVSYWGIALAALIRSRPCFVEMHAPKKKTFVHRLLFRAVSGIIAINDSIKNKLAQTFPRLQEKIIVCPNGVDLKAYEGLKKKAARKTLGLPQQKTLVIYTGSFQDWKGIKTSIMAASLLHDPVFYFVGGSENDLKNAGVAVRKPPNVHFVGKRGFKEMPLWHKSADILLVTGTNKDWYSREYTSPMKLFEYMAAGCPVVASRTRAIEQVVSDKEVFFHNPDDVDSLVKTIKIVLQQSHRAEEKARNAYTLAQNYSWRKRASTIKKYMQKNYG